MKKQMLIGLLLALGVQSSVVARCEKRSLCKQGRPEVAQQLFLASIDRSLAVAGAGLVGLVTLLSDSKMEIAPHAAAVATIFGYVGYEAHKKFTPLYETFKKARSESIEQCIRDPETGSCVKVPCSCKSAN